MAKGGGFGLVIVGGIVLGGIYLLLTGSLCAWLPPALSFAPFCTRGGTPGSQGYRSKVGMYYG